MSVDKLHNSNNSVNNLANSRLQNAYNINQQKQVQVNNAKAESMPANNTKVATDAVSVSDTAQRLNNAQEKAKASPAFDEKKVNSIKKAIEDGSFTINYERLADKLLNSEESLSSILK